MLDANRSASSQLLRLLSLTSALIVAVACENGVNSVAPTRASSVPAVTSASSVSQGKIDICHRTQGSQKFMLLSVAASALDAHLAHGDGRVGDPVPGAPGSQFGPNCSAVMASRVIYSNFGPGMTFDTDATHSWTINGFLSPGVGQQAIAQRFVPAATATFGGAQVALTLFSGTASVAVFLQADSSGLPGAVIEQMSVSGLTGVPSVFTATSALFPQLQAGTAYWLTVVAGAPGVLAGWNWNSIGDISTSENFAGTQGGSPLGPWGLNPSPVTRAVFQINGI